MHPKKVSLENAVGVVKVIEIRILIPNIDSWTVSKAKRSYVY